MTDIRLGRLPSPEEERDKYLRRFALTPETAPAKPTYVVFGIDWHKSFSDPVKDRAGYCWIGKGKPRSWGKVAGGHAIMSPPVDAIYQTALFQLYNQGQTPECVAYSHCFGMTLLNSPDPKHPIIYQPDPLYDKCQRVYDQIKGPPPAYDGTEVRAADECMRVEGLLRQGETEWRKEDGIAAYRWAKNVADVHAVRGTDVNLGYIELWNTWGSRWAEGGRVRIPNESMDWLLNRPFADCAVPTDI